jgi:hypothetical protein
MANEARYTNGPWYVNWAGSGKGGQLVYDECYVYAPGTGVDDVAIASDIVDPLTSNPSAANARLIAAAPDMLDALLDALAGHNDPELFLPQVRAAIAKATGERR